VTAARAAVARGASGCSGGAAVAVAIASAALACSDEAVLVDPVYDLPAASDDASPAQLDAVVLAVARAGAAQDLASQSFSPGARAVLAGVPFADDLVVHLTGQIGGSVVAYGRTCAFAVAPGEPAPRPHLWFARTVKFASVAAPAAARTGGLAAGLAGGALVVAGDAGALEWFDPRAGALVALGELAPRARASAAAIGAAGAPRLALVGGEAGGAPVAAAELIELVGAGARIERVEDARLARVSATATALVDGRVVVIGGRGPGGAPRGDLVELTATGTGAELRTARAELAHPRAEHTATRLGDDVGARVLVIGGARAAGLAPVAELWKPLSGELADPAAFAPALVVPRRGHRAELMPDGSVLVIGGVDAAGLPVRTLERFELDTGFRAAGELPPGAGVLDLTTTRLPDGRILIAGGRASLGGPPVDTALIARLDVVDGSVDVVQTDRLAAPRAGHYAAPLCDGTLWLGGGAAPPAPAAERYSPPPPGRR
jgi:hypothetical protein